MSFCMKSTVNHASSGRSSTRSARAFSIGEPIGLCVITSTARLRSTPARSAKTRPSAKATICTARLMLIASLSTSPCPLSPMYVGVPSSRRIGSTRA